MFAGAQLHVHGSEEADAEAMPMVGGDAAAAAGSMYMPPPEPEDEQGGHDGEDDDEGDEEYIPHPEDDEEALTEQLETFVTALIIIMVEAGEDPPRSLTELRTIKCLPIPTIPDVQFLVVLCWL